MNALVSKIHPPKVSNNGGTFYKIEFITQPDKEWTFTYVSPSMNNFDRWEDIINAPHGIWVSQLQYKDWNGKQIIDADSPVIFYNKKRNRAASQLSFAF